MNSERWLILLWRNCNRQHKIKISLKITFLNANRKKIHNNNYFLSLFHFFFLKTNTSIFFVVVALVFEFMHSFYFHLIKIQWKRLFKLSSGFCFGCIFHSVYILSERQTKKKKPKNNRQKKMKSKEQHNIHLIVCVNAMIVIGKNLRGKSAKWKMAKENVSKHQTDFSKKIRNFQLKTMRLVIREFELRIIPFCCLWFLRNKISPWGKRISDRPARKMGVSDISSATRITLFREREREREFISGSESRKGRTKIHSWNWEKTTETSKRCFSF